jgi:hypothetical protein
MVIAVPMGIRYAFVQANILLIIEISTVVKAHSLGFYLLKVRWYFYPLRQNFLISMPINSAASRYTS